jgi:hypothetical protein
VANLTALKDYMIAGLGIVGIKIRLTDNGDGTYSEGASGSGGAAGSAVSEELVVDSVGVLGVRRLTIGPTGTVAVAYTNFDGTAWTPTGAISQPPEVHTASTNATSTAYASSLILKASAGRLMSVSFYNSGPAQFFQLHDSATLPAEATVPKSVIYVANKGSGGWDYGLRGRSFAAGIVICNSTTGPTKTIGAADTFFDGQVQ